MRRRLARRAPSVARRLAARASPSPSGVHRTRCAFGEPSCHASSSRAHRAPARRPRSEATGAADDAACARPQIGAHAVHSTPPLFARACRARDAASTRPRRRAPSASASSPPSQRTPRRCAAARGTPSASSALREQPGRLPTRAPARRRRARRASIASKSLAAVRATSCSAPSWQNGCGASASHAARARHKAQRAARRATRAESPQRSAASRAHSTPRARRMRSMSRRALLELVRILDRLEAPVLAVARHLEAAAHGRNAESSPTRRSNWIASRPSTFLRTRNQVSGEVAIERARVEHERVGVEVRDASAIEALREAEVLDDLQHAVDARRRAARLARRPAARPRPSSATPPRGARR